MKFAAALLVCAAAASAQNRVLTTVIDPKTGQIVRDLKPADFLFYEDKTVKPVLAAETKPEMLDILLLVDTSVAGPMVAPLAGAMIQQLDPKEQMSVISVHSSADLIQDFTSSKDLLRQSLLKVKFGNNPLPFEALYAAADDGFKGTAGRRVVLLLTAGVDAGSRLREKDVISKARRAGVSIYPIYVSGWDKSRFDDVARGTGGAPFSLRDLRKVTADEIGKRVFEVVRNPYVLTVAGSLALGEKLKIEINRPGSKLFASVLPLE